MPWLRSEIAKNSPVRKLTTRFYISQWSKSVKSLKIPAEFTMKKVHSTCNEKSTNHYIFKSK